jgi:hypothetical protein
MSFHDKTARRLTIWGIGAGAGVIGCLYGLVQAGPLNARPWMRFFAFTSTAFTLILIFGVGIPLMFRVARGESRKIMVETPLRVEKEIYIVRQSVSDRVQIILLAIAFALITAFAYARGFSIWSKCILSTMLFLLVLMALGYCFRTVCFTDDSIRVQTFPFIEFTESYRGVTLLQPRRGSLLVHLSNGKTLNLRPGLRDSERVRLILAERIEAHSGSSFEHNLDRES